MSIQVVVASTEEYKLQKKIKDAKFSIDNLHNYHLSLQLGRQDFQVCVTNVENNRVLLLEDYIFKRDLPIDEKLEQLRKIWENHHVLMAGFWKSITFSGKTNKYSLVPNQLFIKDHLRDYLQLNTPISEGDELLYYKMNKAPIVTVFAENKKLLDFIQGFYPKKVQFVHNSASLLEGILHSYAQSNERRVFLHVDRFFLQIIGIEDKKISFYNQFKIKSFDDYIKYTISVMKGLHLDPEKSQVVMWGHLKKNSKHYKALQERIPNLSFGPRIKKFSFAHMFDEIQEHTFFDLFSLYFCQ